MHFSPAERNFAEQGVPLSTDHYSNVSGKFVGKLKELRADVNVFFIRRDCTAIRH